MNTWEGRTVSQDSTVRGSIEDLVHRLDWISNAHIASIGCRDFRNADVAWLGVPLNTEAVAHCGCSVSVGKVNVDLTRARYLTIGVGRASHNHQRHEPLKHRTHKR